MPALSSQLSQEEIERLAKELGLPMTNGMIPSEKEVVEQLKTLEREGEITQDQISSANKLIDYNRQKQSEVRPVSNKFNTDPELVKEKIIDNTTDHSHDKTFANAHNFTQKGVITTRSIDNTSIVSPEKDHFTQKFNQKLDAMSFSAGKPVVIGTAATGYIVGVNLARTASIAGNFQVRLGTTNDISERQVNKVGLAAIEAATKDPATTAIALEGLSKNVSDDFKEQAVARGFKPENIEVTNTAADKKDEQNKNSPLGQNREQNSPDVNMGYRSPTPFDNMRPTPFKES